MLPSSLIEYENDSGGGANTVGVDIVLPYALYYANDSGGLDQVECGFLDAWRAQD